MSTERFSLVDQAISINRPIETVFDFVTNLENYQSWFPNIVSMRVFGGTEDLKVGRKYEETIRLPTGRSQSMIITVIDHQAPTRFESTGDFRPLLPNMMIDCSSTGEGATVLRLRFFSRQKNPIGRFLIRMILRPTLRRSANAGLMKLKEILEFY